MDTDLEDLRKRLAALEDEFEHKLQMRRAEFQYQIKRKRVVFEQAVLDEQRRLKVRLLTFLSATRWSVLIVAPMTYLLFIPVLLLDLSVSLYQSMCFPLLGIRRVKRSDYVRMDRRHLAYLNGLQKLNCEYCGYANGVIAYAREVAGRSEQYWCPIKHAFRIKTPHLQYRNFLDYGDAQGFRDRLGDLRHQLGDKENR
ncbi:MAG: hypothetical protein ACE363_03970 [Alphaproteobacteria bacterium]